VNSRTREHIAETLYNITWNHGIANCLAWFTVVFDVSQWVIYFKIRSRVISYSRFFWKLGPLWRQ